MKNFNNLENHWSKLPNREEILKRISETIKKQFKNGRITWSKGKGGVHFSPHSEWKKGHLPWNTGRKCPELSGKNNPNWKGGLSYNLNHKKKWRKEYKRTHRLQNRIYQLKRKHNLLDLSIQTVQQTYEDNIKKYGTLTCYLCEKSIEFGNDSIDHKIPLSRGGNSLYENLAVAHRKCNSIKGIKTETEYREYIKVND